MSNKLRELAAKCMVCKHCCCIVNDFVKCSTYGKRRARSINPRDEIGYCRCTKNGTIDPPSHSCLTCGGAGVIVTSRPCH